MKHTLRSVCLILIFCWTGLSTMSFAGEDAGLKEVLRRPIVPSELLLAAEQVYTEVRVLTMPEVDSIEAWQRHTRRIRQDLLDRVGQMPMMAPRRRPRRAPSVGLR